MKSLLFTSEMVQTILAGKKTQTRRIFKDVYFKTKYTQGDILYVRENFAKVGDRIFYKADNNDIENAGLKGMYNFKWTPSIYMPQALSRIAIKITDLRVERLQNISAIDVEREGVKTKQTEKGILYDMAGCGFFTFIPETAYYYLWNKINGVDSHLLNPLVYVITFEVLEHAPAAYNR